MFFVIFCFWSKGLRREGLFTIVSLLSEVAASLLNILRDSITLANLAWLSLLVVVETFDPKIFLDCADI